MHLSGVCWSISGKLLSLNILFPNPVALSRNVSQLCPQLRETLISTVVENFVLLFPQMPFLLSLTTSLSVFKLKISSPYKFKGAYVHFYKTELYRRLLRMLSPFSVCLLPFIAFVMIFFFPIQIAHYPVFCGHFCFHLAFQL